MSPRHGPGCEEIDAVARRVRGDFDQLSEDGKGEVRDLVLSVFRSFEAEGWDMLSREEKATFEMAQWMFLRVDANIVAATPKAVILLSLHAAIISVAVLGGDRIVQELDATLRPVVGALIVALFLAAITSLWLVFSSLIPRTARNTDRDSVLYFGTIARMTREEFVERFESRDRGRFSRDLVEDLHALADLAAWKHRTFQRAFQAVLYVEIPIMGLLAILVALGR
jgi:hypothetical protein